ncbi:VWA domain-containing protein [uncultured Tateyamaria sp.]|uniref:vWA domain-containing protein n=1 Tax=uncultured Tateyamaria sp. TaxID=455651 RepID=UPI002636CCD7|nr:VWA domain-containing protein [uncultured Tateyamaria sp.]
MSARVLQPFFALSVALRQAGVAVSPDQTQGFIAAVGALGPRGIGDVRQAALALFAIPPERRGEFDAIFAAIFEGQIIAADAQTEDESETDAIEPTDESAEVEIEEVDEPAGEEATGVERLTSRPVIMHPQAALESFAREASERLPERLSYRRRPNRHGDRIDLRRMLRLAARTDGDIFELPRSARKRRQRRIVCLIDVSGSMKDRSDELLAFAHVLVQAAQRAEVFTLGTRLTRVTGPLHLADRGAALRRVSEAVADLDGGTRLGEALSAFLAVPRYAGLARGALVIVLSDGLERGDPVQMIEATARLSRLAWRLHWLTPLAEGPAFRPETAALQGVLPWLDHLSSGASTDAICTHILNIARAA